MSKVSMPRPRYIAFEVASAQPLGRQAVAQALRGLPGDPHLTRYAFPHGIVRVRHPHDRACRDALARVAQVAGHSVEVRPLSTSGTLKAVTTRLGILQGQDA